MLDITGFCSSNFEYVNDETVAMIKRRVEDILEHLNGFTPFTNTTHSVLQMVWPGVVQHLKSEGILEDHPRLPGCI